MPRQKISRGPAHARERAAPTLSVPAWIPRRSARLRHQQEQAEVPPSEEQEDVPSSSDASDDEEAAGVRSSSAVMPRGRPPRQKKTKRATTTTTRKVAVTRRRTTIEAYGGMRLTQPPDDTVLARVVGFATQVEDHAHQNEVARAEERRDAARLLHEAMESNVRKTELVTTAFRKTMDASGKAFREAVETMARQNEALVRVVREMQPSRETGPREGVSEM